MDEREKLIELLLSVPVPRQYEVGVRNGKRLIAASIIADHLIANGVSLGNKTSDKTSDKTSEWIPASEPPKKRGAYLSYIKYEPDSPDVVVENYYFGGRRWMSDTDRVTHWMPMPDQPKGE